MLDQELVLSTKTGLDQQSHLNNPYAQFHQYQQSMATYNNMGYAFPAAMYPQNGYGYQLSPYPHAPTSPTHDITEKPEGGTVRLTAKGKKIRKPRTIYSSLQVQQLNKMFQRTQYLALPERAELAAKLGLTQTQVKIWFQNRRSKCKKMYKAVQNGQLAGFDAAELAADLGGKLSQMMVGPESPMPSPHHNPGGDASLSGGPRGDTDPTSPPDQKPRHSESENCASGAAASLLAQRHASEASGGPHSNIPIGALQGELQGMMSTRDMTSPRSEGMRDMMMSSPQTTTENPSEHRRTATTTTMMQHSREHFVVSHKDCDSPIANYPSNAPFSPKSMQGVPDSYFSQRKNEYPPSMMMYQNAGQIDPAHYMYWHYGDMSNAQQQIMT